MRVRYDVYLPLVLFPKIASTLQHSYIHGNFHIWKENTTTHYVITHYNQHNESKLMSKYDACCEQWTAKYMQVSQHAYMAQSTWIYPRKQLCGLIIVLAVININMTCTVNKIWGSDTIFSFRAIHIFTCWSYRKIPQVWMKNAAVNACVYQFVFRQRLPKDQ